MRIPWRRSKIPQVLFANSELSSMHVSLEDVHVQRNLMTNLQLNVDFIFSLGAKQLPQNLLENIIDDFLREHVDHVLATDGSMVASTKLVFDSSPPLSIFTFRFVCQITLLFSMWN